MKCTLLLISFIFPFLCFYSQEATPQRWRMEFGWTKHVGNPQINGINVRAISPSFKVGTDADYWTEEEEKHPERFKKTKFLFEFMYAPSYRVTDWFYETHYVLSAGFQHILLRYKIISLDATAGMFLLSRTSNYDRNAFFNVEYKWFFGLLGRVKLGIFSPFIEIKSNWYYTFGSEIELSAISFRQKRKYKLNLNKVPD